MNSEKSKSKDLATKLYQTQAELNMIRTQGQIKTPLAPSRLNFETTSPISNKSTHKTPYQTTFHK